MFLVQPYDILVQRLASHDAHLEMKMILDLGQVINDSSTLKQDTFSKEDDLALKS